MICNDILPIRIHGLEFQTQKKKGCFSSVPETTWLLMGMHITTTCHSDPESHSESESLSESDSAPESDSRFYFALYGN